MSTQEKTGGGGVFVFAGDTGALETWLRGRGWGVVRGLGGADGSYLVQRFSPYDATGVRPGERLVVRPDGTMGVTGPRSAVRSRRRYGKVRGR
ncbi:hypothetical protein [Streptomyces sp. NPDC051567]|uniref:hypothetical protein n=1 Tax=Streptomyces sp. NPDC051567 TaxID=3365660 RepID=UPI0037BBC56C